MAEQLWTDERSRQHSPVPQKGSATMIPPEIVKALKSSCEMAKVCARSIDVAPLQDDIHRQAGIALAYLDTLPAAPAPDSGELLPCPFCGGHGVIHVDYVLGPNEPLYSPMCEHLSYWYAHRFQPGHKGHPKCGGGIGASFTTRAEAIAAWNRRTTLVARPTEDK